MRKLILLVLFLLSSLSLFAQWDCGSMFIYNTRFSGQDVVCSGTSTQMSFSLYIGTGGVVFVNIIVELWNMDKNSATGVSKEEKNICVFPRCSTAVDVSRRNQTWTFEIPENSEPGNYAFKTIVYQSSPTNGLMCYTRAFKVIKPNPISSTITHSTGVLGAGTYQAGQTIDSKANISSPTTFIAGQSILLTNGFSAGPNETFLALIGGCNTNTIPTNGLVAYFSFDGNANDTGGNTGTVSGATLTTDRKGVANKAYSFDGNDKITATDNNLPTGNTPRTFSIWVYSNSQQSNTTPATLLSYGTPSSNTNHYSFVMWGNKLRLSNWSGAPDIDYTYSHPVNQWFHLVIKLDESNVVKIYVNGALQHTSSVIETWNTVKNGQLIFGENLVQGRLDEIRIYNRAITNDEVLQIYNAEKP